MTYRVRVADMFHYMDQDEEYELEPFRSLEAAERSAKAMVDRDLRHMLRFRMTAPELVDLWHGFGIDPCIVSPVGEPRSTFDAATYVRERAAILCRPHRRLAACLGTWARESAPSWLRAIGLRL